MRVLIAGCGYVGLALGAELTRQGHDVWGIRRSPAPGPTLENGGVKWLTADITRLETLAPLRSEWEWVVESVSAGQSGVEGYRRVYLEGTRNLISWLAASPPRKFVYTSSTGVYAQNDGSTVTEESPTAPETETGKILLAAEQVLLEAAAPPKCFPAIILRVAGIYGPGRGFWLRRFLTQGSESLDDPGRVVNMIHRDDVAGAIIAALRHGSPGAIYNAADDEPTSPAALFEWFSATCRRTLPHAKTEVPPPRRPRATSKRVSNRKLKMELGYQFKYPTFRAGYGEELQRLAGAP